MAIAGAVDPKVFSIRVAPEAVVGQGATGGESGWGGEAGLALARHGMRTATLAGLVAREMGWDGEAAHRLVRAARLHDVGKLLLPVELWTKEGALSEDERRLVRRHAALGADWLAACGGSPLSVCLARLHHERWDGSGYPHGVAGHRIPQAARIVAAADVFDALTEDRPYRPARSAARALEWLRERAGSGFDPEVVAALADVLRGRTEAA